MAILKAELILARSAPEQRPARELIHRPSVAPAASEEQTWIP